MKTLRAKQVGFATPAMFLAVLVAFVGSLGAKGKDGTTVAEAMGWQPVKQSEFAVMEPLQTSDRPWVDE